MRMPRPRSSTRRRRCRHPSTTHSRSQKAVRQSAREHADGAGTRRIACNVRGAEAPTQWKLWIMTARTSLMRGRARDSAQCVSCICRGCFRRLLLRNARIAPLSDELPFTRLDPTIVKSRQSSLLASRASTVASDELLSLKSSTSSRVQHSP